MNNVESVATADQNYPGEYDWDNEAVTEDDPTFPLLQVAKQAYAVFQNVKRKGAGKSMPLGQGHWDSRSNSSINCRQWDPSGAVGR